MASDNIVDFYTKLSQFNFDLDNARSQFKFWNVESLLNQSADLLERCVQEMNYAKTLQIAAKEIELQLTRTKKKYEANRDFVTSTILQDRIERAKTKLGGARANSERYQDMIHQSGNVYGKYPNTDIINRSKAMLEQQIQIVKQSDNNQYILDLEHRIEFLTKDKTLQEEQSKADMDFIDTWEDVSKSPMISGRREQAQHAIERCYRDFDNAWERLVVAYDGLVGIFNYSGSKPPMSSSTEWKNDDLIHEMYLWVREAIQWLQRWSQMDQYFSISIPLSKLVEDIDLSLHYKNHQPIAFVFPIASIGGYRFVRFRHISCRVHSNNSDASPYALEIKLPDNGLARFDRDNYSDLDQSGLPPIRLGHVLSSVDSRPSEPCGQDSHYNASPIGDGSVSGKWMLSFVQIDEFTDSAAKINDVELHLGLVGRAI